jgi:RecB family exonuclease
VFATGDAAPGAVSDPSGLRIEGAPQGDGTARVVGREVRGLLRRGIAPEEILVVFRRWDDDADLTRELLESWGIPTWSESAQPLFREPAAGALRLAASIPLEDWETERIVRLLRHGQLRPRWPGADLHGLADAAAVVRSTQVFRGKEALSRGLDRASAQHPPGTPEVARVEHARRIVERLGGLLASAAETPRPWPDQVEELRRLARELGIEEAGGGVLEPLWEALDDQSDLLAGLGQAGRTRSWSAFIAEMESTLRALSRPVPAPGPGTVRLATVESAAGAMADHVVLAGLAEGSFPDRAAVRPFLNLRPGDDPSPEDRVRFAREMALFLDVLGSARAELLLVHPTTNLEGHELLRAGFLDDLLACLGPDLAGSRHRAIPRLHPALIDQEDLAGAPGELRVRAAALAAERGESEPLRRLAALPSHREVFRGTASALFAQRQRLRGTPFGEYDGLLRDGAAILEIDRKFGPAYRFSPSQLETYLSCPFQFFSKYVLGLKVVEERDELDEDATERGSKLHDLLEEHERRTLELGDAIPEGDHEAITRNTLQAQGPAGATDLDLGLWEIERERLIRTFDQYCLQRRAYRGEGAARFGPLKLEFAFGDEGAIHPVLVLSLGGRQVLLRGRIDRVDVAETEAGRRFRVIDYKSGSAPAVTDVKQGAMLQLPLYAMAVQRLLFHDDEAALSDLGYWSLRKTGYSPISFAAWEQDQEALVEHVLALVDRLRRGEFVVLSRKDACENYCEYRGVCRVRQVRRAGKQRALSLPVLSASSPRRGTSRGKGAAPAPGGGS